MTVTWLRAEALLCDLDGSLVDSAHAVAMPGAAMVIGELVGVGARWAVVTSADPASAGVRLEAAGLPLPPVLVTADDVTRSEPHPDGFLRAAGLLDADPTRCLVVVATQDGVTAGLASGARVLLVGEPIPLPDDARVLAFRWADVVDIRGGPDDVVLHMR